uniref:Uncharacterized protein n=1 Tax=Rhizophora mucronata TaxID=61149 RepID=A0A2P2MYG0_RHIMU
MIICLLVILCCYKNRLNEFSVS